MILMIIVCIIIISSSSSSSSSIIQGEFKFTIPGDTAAAIVKNLSGGAKGVKKDI